MTEVVESILNTKSSYNDCDHCSSVLSPAAYFVKLMETVEKYIEQPTNGKDLKSRRPDLYNIKLDCDNTNKEKLYLEIVNKIMEENLDKKLGGNALQKLATAKYPFNLPANFPLISIRAYLEKQGITLADLYRVLKPEADNVAESLGLSPEEYELITSTSSNLGEVYGISESELKNVEKFIAQTGIGDKLKLLLDSYNKVKKPAKLSIDSTNQTIESLDNQALGFLHRFIRLANKLNWSFEELSDVLVVVGKDEINADLVKQIARIKNLQERFKQPMTKIVELYAQADILSKKLENLSEFKSLLSQNYTKLQDLVVSANEHSVNGYSALQNILSVSSSELTSLIEYNNNISSQTGKLLLFRVYKQVSLARLIGVSIAEFTQLNIDKLNLDNIENVVELNDWLKNHSITTEQLNKLISFSDKKLVEQIRSSLDSSSILLREQLRKKIQELISLPNDTDEKLKKQIQDELVGFSDEQLKEQIQNTLSKYSGDQLKKELNHLLQKIKEENLHNFYNIIHKHIGNLQPDMLAAVHEFTDPQKSQAFSDVLAKLIHNIEVLTKLKLSVEDISNITKDTYGIQAEWSLSQIKTLVNYKNLKDIFSSGGITLPQYTDWLNGADYNENKVVEKIAQLTGWNEDTLEDVKEVEALKPCFAKTQNPIDSLIKIKSFMDLVTKSGINSKVLLSLKDLYNLAVGSDNSGWKKYADAAENLKLSAKSEAKDKAEKYLAEQKRDILAKYMIHEYELKNMRDLYSYLLIDVEMSDCSVISPLKAALNSVQLYIHRSMMKLEKDVKIKPELNEEKWKWLSHYREWEASNKIKLYPENYLNPTLRRITTPGYKTLQNTLMQGNITDEAVSNAYMKYFEDFEEVTSLKIVDSCFERVEDKTSGGEKNTLCIIGRTLAQPYNYYYRTAIFDEKNQQILYWTAWDKIGASIPVETVTPIYAFHRLFLFWVQQTKKKEINMTKYSGGKDSPLSENAHVTINYTFQKPSGSWTAPQKLADNIEVDPTKADTKVDPIKDVEKLHWKKVAAFYLKEGEERSVIISMGEIKPNNPCLFILDEDLIASKKALKFSEDIQDNSELKSTTRQLFYDIDKSKKGKEGKLSLKFITQSIFKSNATNREGSAESASDSSTIELLGKFKISSAQQVVNKPGWFIIEGNLERENVRESFLLFPKEYDLSSISERSIYEVNGEGIKLKYDSRIPQIDLTDTEFEFIRLNITGSVRKLRQKAYAGGPKRILTLDSQKIKQLDFTRFQPADAVVHYPPDILDFSGAYSIYLWEIFFHIPTLIAWHLNGEQNFSAAREWYQYILNPTNDKSQAWRFLPFTNRNEESITNDLGNTQTIKELEEDPFDPYVIAKQRPTAFEKYIIKSYVDNLIDWGDMLFAKKSWEALNQTTMLYVRAWDLLGHKPIKKGKFIVEAKTFEELKSNQESGTLCRLEAELPSTNAQLTRMQPAHEAYGISKYGCYFCKPENEEFIGLWDKIEDRLYKIRHCLDITGKRLELPLFQAPIDPRQLIQTISGSGSSITVPSIDQLPHYRFNYMIAYARSIVETVVQFGSELLSVLEKRDAEALAILYNKQEGIIANLITSIKEKAIEALKEEAKALNVSLSSAKDRESHYKNLIDSGLSAGEKGAIALSSEAVDGKTVIAGIRGAAIAAHLIPTVYGFADGAFQPGFSVTEGANIAESAGIILNEKAQIAYTRESYKRRAEDWELQRIMASHDTEQINYQIEANKINQGNAEQDLKAHKKSIEQIKEKEEFFKNKFTNQELYNWMKGQIAIIYFQAYKIALEIAKQAEKTYQYELNNNKSFITNNSWNSFKEGSLAGSVLKFALEQMAKGYHDENKRTLEISKVVSLGQINPIALHELKTKGSCKFELTEKLFDLDFPGHYCRKIKNIKITIPAVVGPYENIHASLQQTSNKVVLKPNIDAIKYLLGESGSSQPENGVLRENWQQNQEIALSRGDQDSGLFELNFNDERYLPFEGTGAISSWQLSLLKATNRFDTNKISDVIIHIDYTAFNDGGLADQVKGLSKLKHYHGMLLVNLSTTYPEAWKKFKQTQSGPHELKFKPSAEIFPAYFKNPKIDSNKSVKIIPEAPGVEKIKLNDNDWKKDTFEVAGTFTIGSEWTLKINNADIDKIEKIVVIIPYRAEINW
ncbi:neuraminidase-like domain-containing protein [Wolbachia endosymbiont (group A) of Limnophora tigrina]|uniref:Tc toxin subunit A-related protein n=1 Tax=Wolbachia endosymbiont (group A) of Limnophora tigrina TaxID=3139318 RepID=UPI0035B54095